MMKHRRPRAPRFFMVFLALGALCPPPAYAVQGHGGAEGLVSHQIGHLLFFAAMVYLFVQSRGSQTTESGWKEFRTFLLLIVFWNILTFSGHWAREFVAAENHLRHGGRTVAFVVEDVPGLLFYLSSLDHLLLVPAFFFLLKALKLWRRRS